MKKQHFSWFISPVIITIMIVTGFLFFPYLPDQIAVQWNESGATSFAEKYIIFVFPLLGVAVAVLQFLQYCKSKDQRKYGLLNAVISIILYILQLVICLSSLGYINMEKVNFKMASLLILIACGTLLICFGNKLPKYAKNFYIGVKAPWAYEDNDIWTKTQSFAGKIWFFGGGFIILLGVVSYFLNIQVSAVLLLFCLLFITFAPRLYSKYLYEHKSNG